MSPASVPVLLPPTTCVCVCVCVRARKCLYVAGGWVVRLRAKEKKQE